MATNLVLVPEKVDEYRRGAEQRRQAKADRLAERCARAWEVARQASHLLKREFGARQVMVFGSMLAPGHIHLHSDLDLAACGIEEADLLPAVARLLHLAPEFDIDLVLVEQAPPWLRAIIEEKGVAV